MRFTKWRTSLHNQVGITIEHNARITKHYYLRHISYKVLIAYYNDVYSARCFPQKSSKMRENNPIGLRN